MNLLLPALKEIFENELILKSKGNNIVKIFVQDITQFAFGSNTYHIQNIRDFPCILLDAVSEDIELGEYQGNIAGLSSDGIIKNNLTIKCVIITNYIGKDYEIGLYGNNKVWGIYELADTVKSIFFKNKSISDSSESVITNGQNIIYSGTKRTFVFDSGFRYGWDLTLSYYRYTDYNGIRVSN